MVDKEIGKKNQSENVCCESNSSCCNSSEIDSYINNSVESKSNKDISNDLDKLNLDIYVPLDACACEWSQFMNLVFNAITPYIRLIKYETKNLNSEEARKMNLLSKCVIVDGIKKYTTSFGLKRDLPKLLKEKGLV